MQQKKEMSTNLMRHLLGSIIIDDAIDEELMSETERKDYCAAIFAVYPRLEKDIKKFLHAQLMFVSNNAENWDQILFGRGTFNGMDLLLEHWKKAASEYESIPKDGQFNKNSPISEI